MRPECRAGGGAGSRLSATFLLQSCVLPAVDAASGTAEGSHSPEWMWPTCGKVDSGVGTRHANTRFLQLLMLKCAPVIAAICNHIDRLGGL